MNILVACEESQAVTIELRKLGHRAFSCDLMECSGGHPEWHIMGDCLPLLNGNCTFQTCDGVTHTQNGCWDMLIAFPPCTYLSNAGARWLYSKGRLDEERYKKGMEAKEFFMRFAEADCARIAIENPVSSSVFNMPQYTQEIQPYQFCEIAQNYWHPYTKKTRLWLKGLSPLIPTSPGVKPVGPWVPSGAGRKERDKYGAAKRGQDAVNRAKTFPGIAKAMAKQWAGESERSDNDD